MVLNISDSFGYEKVMPRNLDVSGAMWRKEWTCSHETFVYGSQQILKHIKVTGFQGKDKMSTFIGEVMMEKERVLVPLGLENLSDPEISEQAIREEENVKICCPLCRVGIT